MLVGFQECVRTSCRLRFRNQEAKADNQNPKGHARLHHFYLANDAQCLLWIVNRSNNQPIDRRRHDDASIQIGVSAHEAPTDPATRRREERPSLESSCLSAARPADSFHIIRSATQPPRGPGQTIWRPLDRPTTFSLDHTLDQPTRWIDSTRAGGPFEGIQSAGSEPAPRMEASVSVPGGTKEQERRK